MKSKWFGAAVLVISSASAWGQMTPQQQANLPPSNPNSSQYNTVYLPAMNSAQPPRERWADRWGAIADDGQGTFGIVIDLQSKNRAERAAISACRERGGNDCGVRRTFFNQCAAVISSDQGTATANAPTTEEAISLAMQTCNEDNGTNCHVYYSGCSLPVRVD